MVSKTAKLPKPDQLLSSILKMVSITAKLNLSKLCQGSKKR